MHIVLSLTLRTLIIIFLLTDRIQLHRFVLCMVGHHQITTGHNSSLVPTFGQLAHNQTPHLRAALARIHARHQLLELPRRHPHLNPHPTGTRSRYLLPPLFFMAQWMNSLLHHAKEIPHYVSPTKLKDSYPSGLLCTGSNQTTLTIPINREEGAAHKEPVDHGRLGPRW